MTKTPNSIRATVSILLLALFTGCLTVPSGCSTAPTPAKDPPVNASADWVRYMANANASSLSNGWYRMSIQGVFGSPAHAENGALIWNRDGEAFTINITNAFGAEAYVTNGNLFFQVPEEKERSARPKK